MCLQHLLNCFSSPLLDVRQTGWPSFLYVTSHFPWWWLKIPTLNSVPHTFTFPLIGCDVAAICLVESLRRAWTPSQTPENNRSFTEAVHLVQCCQAKNKNMINTPLVQLKYTTYSNETVTSNAWQSNCRCVSVKLSHYQCKLDRSLAIRSPLSDRTSQKKAWQVECLHFIEVAMQISELARWSEELHVKIAKSFWNKGRHGTF